MNYSDRYLGICAKTKPPGNDPHTVAEALRKAGLAFDSTLPFSDDILSWEDYYSFKGGDERKCINEGVKFLQDYKVGHEWVFNNVSKDVRTALMKEALQYSPLGVSVTAWYEEDGVYVDHGLQNNHWCVVYGYTEANNQVFWKVFDSYDHSEKLLHPDHNISFCKRYSFTLIPKPIPSPAKVSWLSTFINWLGMLFLPEVSYVV